jgi:Protein of unknown function (DUF2829)
VSATPPLVLALRPCSSGVTDFSAALRECVAEGCKISRLGWNGYVVYQPGYPSGIGINANTAKATGIPQGTVMIFGAYLMKYADGVFAPWTPDQRDLLADDWEVITLAE